MACEPGRCARRCSWHRRGQVHALSKVAVDRALLACHDRQSGEEGVDLVLCKGGLMLADEGLDLAPAVQGRERDIGWEGDCNGCLGARAGAGVRAGFGSWGGALGAAVEVGLGRG